jgi:hypothetical protein
LCVRFDRAVRDAFVLITGQLNANLEPGISDLAWEQASLPIPMGGFGFILSAVTCPIAHAASLSDFISHTPSLGRRNFSFPPSLLPDVNAALALIVRYPRRPSPLTGVVATTHVQKHIATAVNAERRNALAMKLNARDLARFTSICSSPSLQWLNAIHSCPELSMSDDLIKYAVHIALGTPFPAPLPPFCLCKSFHPSPDSDIAHHFQVCKASPIIVAHDRMCQLLFELARAAQHTTSDAHSLLNIAIDGSGTRPDGQIHSRLGLQDDIAFDFEFVHPCPPSHSETRPLQAAMRAEQAKVSKHDSNCARFHLVFRPFVMEYFGALGPDASRLFDSLVGEIDPSLFVSPNWAAASPLQYWTQRFSILASSSHASAVRHIHTASLSYAGIRHPPPPVL